MANTGNGGARVASDTELRDNLDDAKQNLAEAKANLKSAVREVRTARRQLRGRKAHTGRNSILFLTGIVLAILFNPATGPATRRWLSGRLGGAGT
jgi:hypothetical protein